MKFAYEDLGDDQFESLIVFLYQCKVAGYRSHRPEPLARLGDSLSPVHPRKWNTQRRFQTAAGSNACLLLMP
jgi:hypothetical protein